MSVYDRSVALHHTGDDADILEQILRMFLDQGPERMALVESALTRGGAKDLEREAHGLKGTAATLGMEELRQTAFAVERMAAEGRLEDAVDGVARMRAAMDAVLAAVRADLG